MFVSEWMVYRCFSKNDFLLCPKLKKTVRMKQKKVQRAKLAISCLTSDGSVSSTRMFGPVVSGPKAQMDLAASRSQSYFVWKNSPSFFLTGGNRTAAG